MRSARVWLSVLVVAAVIAGGWWMTTYDASVGDRPAMEEGTNASAASGHGLPKTISSARIFFSGHSLLDNPMPDFVADIARSQGQEIAWNQQNIIGSLIRARTEGEGGWAGYRQGKNRSGTGMDVLQELRSPQTLPPGERYDTLIITERHDILWSALHENTVGFLRHFHDRFIEGNAEGRTFFYQTWLDIDKANPGHWIAYERNAVVAWECVASKVNLTLEAEGRADRIAVIPGGAALSVLVEDILADRIRGISGPPAQRLDAIFSDTVHLTPLGAYFLAAVHYASVYGRTPVGAAGPPGAHPETVRDLQEVAWRQVSDYFSRSGQASRSMAQCRQRAADLCPTFWEVVTAANPETGWRRALAPVLRARKIRECRNVFSDPEAERNPFVWPDPRFKPLPPP